MQNSCIVTCPCCGQFIQVEISILGARAYPFCSNLYGSVNAIYGNSWPEEKEDNDV